MIALPRRPVVVSSSPSDLVRPMTAASTLNRQALEEFHRRVHRPYGCLVYIELSEIGITRLDAERAVIANGLECGDEAADVAIALSWK